MIRELEFVETLFDVTIVEAAQKLESFSSAERG